MGKPDTVTKEYMRRPDIFADVFNQFLYHGKQKILPERLTELDTTEIAVPYGADDASAPEQRYRDVAKLLAAMTDGRAAYCILAVENETKVNYAMPVKDGLYDFMQLAKQVAETSRTHKKSGNGDRKPSGDEFLSGFWKSDRLLPVVTLTVYFGAGEWDGPLNLKEMYASCDEEILRYAADYRVNLLAPSRLSDGALDEFQTSFREIMKYIKYSTDGNRLKEALNADTRFRKVERQAVDVINATTGSRVTYAEKEERIDMCAALQEIREEGRLEGKREGRLEGRLEGKREGRLEGELEGAITFARDLGIPKDEVKKSFMVKYKKNDEEAEALLKMYWK